MEKNSSGSKSSAMEMIGFFCSLLLLLLMIVIIAAGCYARSGTLTPSVVWLVAVILFSILSALTILTMAGLKLAESDTWR